MPLTAWESPGPPSTEGNGKRYQSMKVEILLMGERLTPPPPVPLLGADRAHSTLVPSP